MNFFKPKFWDKNQTSLYSILLLPLSLVIKIFNWVRYIFVKNKKSSIPVICIGNIYLGGTGKTPLSIELYHILKYLNKNPVFIKKKNDSYQDEKYLLEQVGPVYENLSRNNAIEDAAQNKFDVAVLDDGFQDFSVKKDLAIVCFNEKQWIGNGLIIPSGPLRESLSSLNRASCVVINGEKNSVIEKKILEKNKSIKIFYAKYKSTNIENFKNKKIICFAGIGNPTNFFNLLIREGIKLLEQISFPDHYNYSNDELKKLFEKASKNNAILLTTEKDYLRIDKNYRKNINFLKIETIIENLDQFKEEVKRVI